jgi:hypothetical protein
MHDSVRGACKYARLAACCGGWLLAGCGRGDRSPAGPELQGDIYLVVANGDVKKVAASTVVLIRRSAGLTADIDATCARARDLYADFRAKSDSVDRLAERDGLFAPSHYDAGTRLDTGVHYSKGGDRATQASTAAIKAYEDFATREIGRLALHVMSEKIAEASTGVAGHYTFAYAQPGKYYLWDR